MDSLAAQNIFDLRRGGVDGDDGSINLLFSKDEVTEYLRGLPDVSECQDFSVPLPIPEEYILFANGRAVSTTCTLLVWICEYGHVTVEDDLVTIYSDEDVFTFEIKPGFEPTTWDSAAKLLLLVKDIDKSILQDADEIGGCLVKEVGDVSKADFDTL